MRSRSWSLLACLSLALVGGYLLIRSGNEQDRSARGGEDHPAPNGVPTLNAGIDGQGKGAGDGTDTRNGAGTRPGAVSSATDSETGLQATGDYLRRRLKTMRPEWMRASSTPLPPEWRIATLEGSPGGLKGLVAWWILKRGEDNPVDAMLDKLLLFTESGLTSAERKAVRDQARRYFTEGKLETARAWLKALLIAKGGLKLEVVGETGYAVLESAKGERLHLVLSALVRHGVRSDRLYGHVLAVLEKRNYPAWFIESVAPLLIARAESFPSYLQDDFGEAHWLPLALRAAVARDRVELEPVLTALTHPNDGSPGVLTGHTQALVVNVVLEKHPDKVKDALPRMLRRIRGSCREIKSFVARGLLRKGTDVLVEGLENGTLVWDAEKKQIRRK